jgi:two-component system, cell cycle sensor histidine kinase and response regulator CckA
MTRREDHCVCVARPTSIRSVSVRPWEEAGGLFRSVVDAIRDGVAIVDHAGVQSFVNRAFCEMVGYSRAELIGASPPFRYWPEEHIEQLQAVLGAAVAGASAEYEVCLQRKGGERFPVLVHTGAISEGEHVIAYVATVKDISERKQMERALGLSEQRWRAIAENPFDFVATLDLDLRFTYLNRVAPGVRLEDVLGKATVFDWLPPEYHAVVRETCERAFRELKPGSYEIYVPIVGQYLSTVVGPIVVDGVATGVSLQTRDVTSQRLAEQALRQSQRMEALGRLAGGIAHDFNNLLTPILGNAGLVQLELEEDHPSQANLIDIIAAAERASELVSRVLVFGREQSPQRRPVFVQDVVREVVRFMSASPQANVKLVTELDESCPPVLGAPDELHQVVTNLCTNAMQAVAEKGGTVTLSVRTAELTSGETGLGGTSASRSVAVERGLGVKLGVTDSGVGIPEAQLTRVFDPFFTTRPVGQGTGLGLSIVQNIAARYGGSVTLQSTLGKGTSVHVAFPACSEPTSPPSSDPSPDRPPRALKLVCIDDDPLVLSWFTRTLARAGHRVRAFSDPLEARRCLLASEEDTDCVICDENMPFLTGTGLAAQLAEHGGSPPIVLVSGNMVAGPDARTPNVRARLSKPLTTEVLLAALARVVH